MRIEYNLDPEDWADFGEYHARHSATGRRVVRNGAIGGALLLLVLGAGLGLASKSPVEPIVAVCAAIGWVLYWPRQFIANVRKSMAGREKLCLRGLHFMDAFPEGLHAKCDVTESTVRWVGIRNVIQTDHHLFLMLGETQG